MKEIRFVRVGRYNFSIRHRSNHIEVILVTAMNTRVACDIAARRDGTTIRDNNGLLENKNEQTLTFFERSSKTKKNPSSGRARTLNGPVPIDRFRRNVTLISKIL